MGRPPTKPCLSVEPHGSGNWTDDEGHTWHCNGFTAGTHADLPKEPHP